MSKVRWGFGSAGSVLSLLALLYASVAEAWPVRVGLDLQGGLCLVGTDLGVGPSVLGDGESGTLTFEVTQTLQELTIPIEVRLRPSPSSAWFLDVGPEVNVLLSARQRADAGTSRPSGSSMRRAPSPSASQAEIFEDVGTFGGTRDVTSRFTAASVAVVAGLGLEWGGTHPMQTSLRLQQAIFDQERASPAVVRPTRLLLGWGVSF